MSISEKQLIHILKLGSWSENSIRKKKNKHLYNLNKTIDIFEIKNVAQFISQVAHESAFFKVSKENLNYSEKGLLTVFPKYFKESENQKFFRKKYIAKEYAKKPHLIASIVYLNRMGNKTKKDAIDYIGRGYIQLTGKNLYRKFSNFLEVDFIQKPFLLEREPYCWIVAGWYWYDKKLHKIQNMTKLTKKINGGYNGLQHRIDIYKEVKRILIHH